MDKYFVQLGLRQKGKIVKNEQYSLEQFKKILIIGNDTEAPKIDIIHISLWRRMFDKRDIDMTLNVKLENQLADRNTDQASNTIGYIKRLINKDKFGRKKK